MDDFHVPTVAQPSSASESQAAEPSGETNWSVLGKFLFWFLVMPGSVLLLVKWLLER